MNQIETTKQKRIAYVIGAGSFGIIGILTVLGKIPLFLCIILIVMIAAYMYLVARNEPDELEPDEPEPDSLEEVELE